MVSILNGIKEEKCCMGQIDESWLWHRRMGHISFGDVVKISKKQEIRDMLKIYYEQNTKIT